jgi:hypothetical protein
LWRRPRPRLSCGAKERRRKKKKKKKNEIYYRKMTVSVWR